MEERGDEIKNSSKSDKTVFESHKTSDEYVVKDIDFKAKKDSKKSQIEYFKNIEGADKRKEDAAQKFYKAVKHDRIRRIFFKGWHKFITIPVIILLVAGLGFACYKLFIELPSERREQEQAEQSEQNIKIRESSSEIINHFYDLYESEAEDAEAQAVAYIEEQLANLTGDEYAIVYSAYAKYYYKYFGNYKKALEMLNSLPQDSFDDNTQSKIVSIYLEIYYELEDHDKYSYYDKRYMMLQERIYNSSHVTECATENQEECEYHAEEE